MNNKKLIYIKKKKFQKRINIKLKNNKKNLIINKFILNKKINLKKLI